MNESAKIAFLSRMKYHLLSEKGRRGRITMSHRDLPLRLIIYILHLFL